MNNSNHVQQPVPIYSLSIDDLKTWLEENRQPPYRAAQIMQWVFAKSVQSFDEMSDLSKDLRTRLQERFTLDLPPVEVRQYSDVDDTEKVLTRLSDGEGVETVRMPKFSTKIYTDPKTGKITSPKQKGADAYTLCLSTQAGCLFACRFCASGQRGLERNLTAGEIIAQVLAFTRQGCNVTNIVFMGTGEPLHNLDELRKAVEILCSKHGFGLSPRRITVSTVGLVPEIYRIAQEDWKVKLAVSLHATTDDKRAQLMPLAKSYYIDQLFDALHYYQRRNKRRITFEYLMIDKLNDQEKDAGRLGRLCDGLTCHVNLIPFNPVERTPFQPTPMQKVEQFKKMLLRHGIDATVRFSRGRNIDAACGQLRLHHDR